MAFDFYFAGTQSKETEDLIVGLNANILKSYVNDQKQIQKLIQLKKDGTWQGKFLIDSGAFSAHKSGGDVDVEKYIAWLNENSEFLDWFIQLDHIPGKWMQQRTLDHVKESTEKSWQNYLYMLRKLKQPEKLIPVFHKEEPYSHLERIVNHQIDGQCVHYVCLSGQKDKIGEDRYKWMNTCFATIKNSNNPNIKVHYLGCAIKKELEMFPFTSSDATSWLMCGANGNIMTDYGTIYVSEKGQHKPEHISNMPIEAKHKIEQMANHYNISLQELQEDYRKRSNFNVHYLYDWANNYQYKGQNRFKKGGLF